MWSGGGGHSTGDARTLAVKAGVSFAKPDMMIVVVVVIYLYVFSSRYGRCTRRKDGKTTRQQRRMYIHLCMLLLSI